MEIEVKGVDHLYLAVSDLRKSEQFYDRAMSALGFRKVARPLAGGEWHVHYFNRCLQLTLRRARDAATPHDPYAPGLHHLCLQLEAEDSVDAAYRDLRRYGIEATAPRFYPEYHEDYYAIFLTDPDGIRLELMNRTRARRAIVENWCSFPPIEILPDGSRSEAP